MQAVVGCWQGFLQHYYSYRNWSCTLRGEGSALPLPLLPRCRAAAACAPGQGPKMGALSARKRATAAWRCHLAVSRKGAGLCAECRENEPAKNGRRNQPQGA